MPALVTARLRLVPITLDVVEAVLRGDRAAAEAACGARLPDEWPNADLVARAFPLSLDAIRADPETRLWGDSLVLPLERSGSAGPRSAAEGRRGELLERSGSAGPRSAAEGRRGELLERSGSAGPRSAAEGRRGESLERSGSAGPRSAAEGRRGELLERSGSAGPRSAAEGRRGESLDASDRVLGSVVFHGRPTNGIAEVGYGIADGARGQGLATEATRACVEWALEQDGIIAVRAITFPWHHASLGVIKNCGMLPIGSEPHDVFGEVLVFERKR